MSEKFRMDSEGIELSSIRIPENKPLKKASSISRSTREEPEVSIVQTMSAETLIDMIANSIRNFKRFKFINPVMRVSVFEDTRPITFVDHINMGGQEAIVLNAGRSNEKCNINRVHEGLSEEIDDWLSFGRGAPYQGLFIPAVVQFSGISIAPITQYEVRAPSNKWSLDPYEIWLSTGPTMLNVNLDPTMRRSVRLSSISNAGRPSIPDSPRVSW